MSRAEIHDTDDHVDGVSQAERIVHVLRIYPRISPTMLQMGLGPHTKPELWRPTLNDLVEKGIVVQGTDSRMSPAGRYHQYQYLELSPEHTE